MDERTEARGGYGDGYIDGWKSVPGRGPVPPHIGIVPIYVVPLDMTVYEYGFQKGREEAEASKRGARD